MINLEVTSSGNGFAINVWLDSRSRTWLFPLKIGCWLFQYWLLVVLILVVGCFQWRLVGTDIYSLRSLRCSRIKVARKKNDEEEDLKNEEDEKDEEEEKMRRRRWWPRIPPRCPRSTRSSFPCRALGRSTSSPWRGIDGNSWLSIDDSGLGQVLIMMMILPAFCVNDGTVICNNDDDDDNNDDDDDGDYNLRAAAKVVETTPVAQAAWSLLLSNAITWHETPWSSWVCFLILMISDCSALT